MLSSGNPALQPSQFESQIGYATPSNVMTINGTIVKSAVLVGLMLVTGGVGWAVCHPVTGSGSQGMKIGLLLGSLVATLILGIVLFFSQRSAPVVAPLYALCEGLLLGGISSFYSAKFSGIVPQAVLLTVGLMAVMLLAYTSGAIRATPFVTKMIIMATGAVCLTYLVSMIASLVGYPIPYIHQTGAIGIGFSVVVVAIAAFNFILDFDLIENGSKAQMPKYMEWYAAYGLLVTIAWLYLEILRLLAKLRSDD